MRVPRISIALTVGLGALGIGLQYGEVGKMLGTTQTRSFFWWSPSSTPSSNVVYPNVEFYNNRLRAEPDHVFIDEMLQWKGDYYELEKTHGYIQWLFPIPEQGVNPLASPLRPMEAEAIRSNPEAMKRYLQAYDLMLDFYGMRVKDVQTGEVESDPTAGPDRFENLRSNFHNFLRITRILTSLGEMGMENYKVNWLRYLKHEVFVTKQLHVCRRSYVDFWVPTVQDPAVRKSLLP
jgi:hypothetical protein